MEEKEKSRIFSGLKKKLIKVPKEDLIWKGRSLVQNGILEQSDYEFALRPEIILGEENLFEARYTVDWRRGELDKGTYNSWAGMRFDKYLLENFYVPEFIGVFSRNSIKKENTPLVQIRYHFGKYPGQFEEARREVVEDFCENAGGIFAMIEGIDESSWEQMRKLIEKVKQNKDNPDLLS